MIFEDVKNLLENSGYQRVQLNVPDIYLYHTLLEDRNFYILIANARTVGGAKETLEGIMSQLQRKLQARDVACEFLSLILTDKVVEYRGLVQEGKNVWIIDTLQKKLMIFENQKSSFRKLEHNLELLLDKEREEVVEGSNQESMTRNLSGTSSINIRSFMKKGPICCIAIVLLNTLIFLYMDLVLGYMKSDELISDYGILWIAVKDYHQYYRIFTYMFLHSGFDHLVNNMLVLFFVGQILEHVVSKGRLLAIYFGSGIVAGVVSMVYNMVNGRIVVSVGASGAIFGLVGAMFYILLVNRGRIQNISSRQMIMFIIFSLYGGFTSSNVDNAAHIGGFFAGVILAAILYRKSIKRGE